MQGALWLGERGVSGGRGYTGGGVKRGMEGFLGKGFGGLGSTSVG